LEEKARVGSVRWGKYKTGTPLARFIDEAIWKVVQAELLQSLKAFPQQFLVHQVIEAGKT